MSLSICLCLNGQEPNTATLDLSSSVSTSTCIERDRFAMLAHIMQLFTLWLGLVSARKETGSAHVVGFLLECMDVFLALGWYLVS